MRASLLLSCVSLLCLASAAVVLAADPISPDQWCIEWGTDEKGANPVLVQITRSWSDHARVQQNRAEPSLALIVLC